MDAAKGDEDEKQDGEVRWIERLVVHLHGSPEVCVGQLGINKDGQSVVRGAQEMDGQDEEPDEAEAPAPGSGSRAAMMKNIGRLERNRKHLHRCEKERAPW